MDYYLLVQAQCAAERKGGEVRQTIILAVSATLAVTILALLLLFWVHIKPFPPRLAWVMGLAMGFGYIIGGIMREPR
jgi:ABC-type Fe3+ transport system permease subunit